VLDYFRIKEGIEAEKKEAFKRGAFLSFFFFRQVSKGAQVLRGGGAGGLEDFPDKLA